MLTAHAIDPDTLMECIRKGAIAYLPKETLADLDEELAAIFRAHEQGEPTCKLLFERLGQYFDEKFGPNWKEKEKSFWSEFEISYQIGKGIQERLMHDERVTGKGI